MKNNNHQNLYYRYYSNTTAILQQHNIKNNQAIAEKIKSLLQYYSILKNILPKNFLEK